MSNHRKIAPDSRLKKLTGSNLEAFLDYCGRHGKDHDESFLGKEELEGFMINENITWLLFSNSKITGVFSIMVKRNFRVRIFHTEDDTCNSYQILHDAMIDTLNQEYGCTEYNLYIPEKNEKIIGFFYDLGLLFQRWIFILERDYAPVPPPEFPREYCLKTMTFPEDVPYWTYIRNEAMKELAGFVYYPEEDFLDMNKESCFIEEATLILWNGDQAVGIIRAEKDVQQNEIIGFIGPIALLPEFRDRGLGRNMLRSVIVKLNGIGLCKTALCVNAENKEALKLYIGEGFKETETVLAMRYRG